MVRPPASGLIARLLPVLLVCLAAPLSAATFVIHNQDGPGEGFNDPTPVAPVGGNPGTTLGQQRQNLFQKAAAIWGTAIESNVPIIIQASFDPLTCDASSALLGAAGAVYIVHDFPGAPLPNTSYSAALANALAGYDLEPIYDDIGATFNSDIDNNNNCLSGINWYLGYDHNHGSDVDLLAVLLHEFAHGLGFQGFANLSTGRFVDNVPDIYSRFTLDNSVGLHWDQMTNNQRKTSATNTGNVVWDGPNVLAGATGLLTNGTDPAGHPRLFAPNPIQSASSISHFDTAASPNLLMEPYITANLRSDLDLTDEQLIDVGWTWADADGDGLIFPAEQSLGTDPTNPDSDGDGLTDGEEVNQYATDPLNPDSDGDHLDDGEEVDVYGSDPNHDDTGDLAPRGNPDGVRNAGDLVVMSRLVLGLETPDAREAVLADMNHDEVLNVADLLLFTKALNP